MSLKDLTLQFPEETIEFAGGSFAVRGLGLSDIVLLVSFHREKLTELFSQYAGNGGDGKTIGAEMGLPMGLAFIQIAPTLAAHIIAHAEVREPGEPPAFEVSMRLPVDVQMEALEKILKLTFQTEGGPKKVLETVIRALAGTMKFTADLAT